jgi:cytochrome c
VPRLRAWRPEGHDGQVWALAALPDGRLAFCNDDGTIQLWDPVRGSETTRLESYDAQVWALAALPDGGLASGGDDCTIRLWDPVRGAEAARLEGP